MHTANHVFATKTKPRLGHVQTLLNKVRVEVKDHVMSNEAMLAAVTDTKRGVSLVGAFAILIGTVLVFLIAPGSRRPGQAGRERPDRGIRPRGRGVRQGQRVRYDPHVGGE